VIWLLDCQSALQNAVATAAKLLVYDPSKFIVPLSSQVDMAPVQRRPITLSAQFSSTIAKVISYDPEKPIKHKRRQSGSADEIAQVSRLQMVSSTNVLRMISSQSGPDVSSLLDVTIFLCTM